MGQQQPIPDNTLIEDIKDSKEHTLCIDTELQRQSATRNSTIND